MLAKLFRRPPSSFQVHSRGIARLATMLALGGSVAVGALAPRAISTAAGTPPATPATRAVAPGDTQVVFGPRVFSTPNGVPTNFVERFAVTVLPGRRFTLQVVNGNADGSARVSGGSVVLNGSTILTSSELASGNGSWRRVIQPLSEDTLQVTVQGPAGAKVTVTLESTLNASFLVFGPERFVRKTAAPVTETRQFAISGTAAAPYRICIVNGNADGTQRIASATIRLNGIEIITQSDLNPQVGGLVKEVMLQPQNTLEATLAAQPSGFLDLCVTATDVTAPVITLTAPLANLISRDTLITVSAIVQDETAVTVTVNGAPASTGLGSFSAQTRLATEGQNTIHVVATDAAGHTTDSTRTVIRDTEAPVLTVATPRDGFITTQEALMVSGTVTDLTPVTMNVNGIPLPVGGAGQFAGTVTLAEGANVLTLTATDAARNGTSQVRIVTRDTQAPVLTVNTPMDGATVNADQVTVEGTVTDATAVTVTANGTSLAVAPDHSFRGDVALGDGPNTVAVVATDAAGNHSTISRSVTRQSQNLPPDPATVATPLSPTTAVSVATGTSFLYTGPNPIQTGVAAGTINAVRAAVIRGRVLTRDGQPLSGVKVTVPGHPELGQTLSRSDGMFDLAVNGGELVTVSYERAGFLTAQRPVDVPWQDYVRVQDAALIPLDPAATVIDFAQPAAVARGSAVTDQHGTRQATLIFPPDATASMVLPDGTTQPLSSITVRATEYTIGPNGPKAMPAPLPPTSAYTYAVELSADEALAAGATGVRFGQPVALYVENFLSFPVGTPVPVGVYDRVEGRWVPEDNGRVIRVLDVTTGVATLDVTGSGQPATDSALAELGVTSAERTRLASLYAAGQTLWRVAISHFSSVDLNLPPLLPPGASAPNQKRPKGGAERPKNPCQNPGGSTIICESQTLNEEIGIVGTPYRLVYESDRVPGRKDAYRLEIPLSDDTVPASLKRIELNIAIAGRTFFDTFPPAPNQRTNFTWDGKDAYGRAVAGQSVAIVQVGYVYPVQYAAPAPGRRSFGLLPGTLTGISGISDRAEVSAIQTSRVALGVLPAASAIGGWGLNVHHAYDPVGRVLYKGDGTRQAAGDIPTTIVRVAGDGESDSSGDGGPAVAARLSFPAWAKVTADGRVYIADQINQRVRRVGLDGKIETVAGSGVQCSSPTSPCGDGGPATAAELSNPTGVDVGPDGSIYIAELGNNRVRVVRPDGTIQAFAGSGELRDHRFIFGPTGTGLTPDSVVIGPTGDGGPATQALLNFSASVAVGPDGSVYITDGSRLRRVGPDGIITTVAGNDSFPGFAPDTGPSGDGQLARTVSLFTLFGVAIGPDGSVYTSEFNGRGRLRRVTPDGILHTVAGNGTTACTDPLCGDGGPARQAIVDAWGMAVGRDGAVYVADFRHQVVRRVDQRGMITTVAGTPGNLAGCSPSTGACGDGGPALRGQLSGPAAVAPAPDGSLYVVELSGHRVRRVLPSLPGFSAGDIAVAAEDGSEVHQFDANGRHLRTLDASTGTARLTFQYDSAGRLAGVLDRDSSVTVVQRSADGSASAVVSAFGQRTTIRTDSNGFLSGVMSAAGDSTVVGNSLDGLLMQLTDRGGGIHRFSYDSLGRLTQDEGPGGNVLTLSRVETDSGFTVSLKTALGRISTYTVQPLTNGDTRRQFTAPSGLQPVTQIASDGSRTITYPDGHSTTTRPAGDPRFGMQAPAVQGFAVTTPSGLRFEARESRHVVLADQANPLSVTARSDTVFINGQVYTSDFDKVSGTLTRLTPEGHRATSRIDAKGRLVMVAPAGLDSTVFAYDARGRLAATTQRDRITTYTYDSLSRLSGVTDPLGQSIGLDHDAAGRVTRQRLPDGREVRFTHNPTGNVVSVVNPRGFAYGFIYNSANLLESLTMPNIGSGPAAIQYAYDADRRFVRITKPDARTITFAYDSITGRPTTLSVPEGTVRHMFDPATGNLASVSAPNGAVVAFTYEGGLPVKTTWTGAVTGSIQASYNNSLRTATLSVNDGSAVAYEYDRDGRLIRAGDLQVGRNGAGGRPSLTTLGTVTTSESYSGFGELSAFTASISSSQAYAVSYTRDRLGRIVAVTETIQGQATTLSYEYDPRGRLNSVNSGSGAVATYEYDENGNRVRFTGPGGVLTGAYDARDQLISYGGTSYAYSPNGEVIRAVTTTDTTWYTYNTFGSLVSAVLSTGKRVDYVLDAANRRIGRQVDGVLVQGFLYQDQLRLVAELNGNNNLVSRFVYGTRPYTPDFMIKNGATYRIIADHVGSVRLVINVQTGEIVQRIDYDEFGRVTRNTNPGFQPFGFAGGIYDEDTKLTHFGAREYDAFTGRWTSQDPAAFVGGTNLHAYTGNDPINFGDPSGLDPCACNQQLLRGLDNDLRYQRRNAGVKPYFTPDVADKLSDAIRTLNSWGINPTINAGYRTEEDQQRLAANPNPCCQAADPTKGPSWHQLGYAVDLRIGWFERGRVAELENYTLDAQTIISVMSENGFTWGGTWNSPDYPHFQVRLPEGLNRAETARQLEDYFHRCLEQTT